MTVIPKRHRRTLTVAQWIHDHVDETFHGYRVWDDLATAAPRNPPQRSSIYLVLGRLRERGWLDAVWVTSTDGPRRRCYTVTAAGRAGLAALLRLDEVDAGVTT